MKKRGILMVNLAMAIVFTLLILGAAMAKGGEFLNTGRTARATADAAQIGAAISQYKFELGNYPANLNELTRKVDAFGPWLRKVPVDPWNNAYEYRKNADGFAVWSKGRDKTTNGSSAAAIGKGDIGFVGR